MNRYVTLLAIYLLGLSLWPCADELLLPNGKVATTYATLTSQPSQEAAQHQHDQCTPFCSCTCCAIVLITTPPFDYSLTRSVDMDPLQEGPFTYTPRHGANTFSAIWQPPKLRV